MFFEFSYSYLGAWILLLHEQTNSTHAATQGLCANEERAWKYHPLCRAGRTVSTPSRSSCSEHEDGDPVGTVSVHRTFAARSLSNTGEALVYCSGRSSAAKSLSLCSAQGRARRNQQKKHEQFCLRACTTRQKHEQCNNAVGWNRQRCIQAAFTVSRWPCKVRSELARAARSEAEAQLVSKH